MAFAESELHGIVDRIHELHDDAEIWIDHLRRALITEPPETIVATAHHLQCIHDEIAELSRLLVADANRHLHG